MDKTWILAINSYENVIIIIRLFSSAQWNLKINSWKKTYYKAFSNKSNQWVLWPLTVSVEVSHFLNFSLQFVP